MIFGNFEFAISYDILSRNENCILGLFNIIVDGDLLVHKGANWTIDLNIADLKSILKKFNFDDATDSKQSKEDLFISAARSFKSNVCSDPYYPEEWLDESDPIYLNTIDALDKLSNYWASKKVGINIYTQELEDYGLQIYLFVDGTQERLIYSYDDGKTIFEKRLTKGTVQKVLMELPDLTLI
jgi:hypothetical protein